MATARRPEAGGPGGPAGPGERAAPAVWTRAANPWWEAMAAPPPEGRAARRPGVWQRVLSWLVEYSRY